MSVPVRLPCHRALAVMAAFAFVLTCGGNAQAQPAVSGQSTYKEIEVKDGGAIRGQVLWKGDVPKEAATEVAVGLPHQTGCKCKTVSVDRLRIDEATKGVAGCVVYLQKIEAGKKLPPAGTDLATGKPAVIDQVDCRYSPDLLVVPVNSELVVTSSDNLAHNVNARMGAGTKFNLLIPRSGAKESGPHTNVGKTPGVISLACNAGHPWMSGYVHVVSHPYYAVTDKAGKFELTDVPPGKYKLVCWHRNWSPRPVRDAGGNVTEVQYGRPVELVREVEVTAGKTSEAEFVLSAEAARARRRE